MPKATLYWIHLPSHQHVSTEGYVGVTTWTPERRLYQLKRRFPDPFNQRDICITILFRGAKNACLTLERSLRPEFNVGWNKYIGGEIEAAIGYVHGSQSEQQRERHSIFMKKLWDNRIFRDQMIEHHNSRSNKKRASLLFKSLWRDPGFRNKMSIALQKTPEQKTAASKAGKTRWRDPDYRTMMTASMKGKVGTSPKSEETKAKMRAAALARYAKPGERIRTSKAVKKALRDR